MEKRRGGEDFEGCPGKVLDMRIGWKGTGVRGHAAPERRYHAAVWLLAFFCLLFVAAGGRCRAEGLSAATLMEAVQKVNVRSGPGTDTETLGKLEAGDRIYAVELTEDGWYRVVYQGDVGYVKEEYLKIYGTDGWEVPEGTEPTGPAGQVIDPQEEYRKAAEEKEAREAERQEAERKEAERQEAERKEAEGQEAERKEAGAAAQEAREDEAEAVRKRSRRITAGVFGGAVLLIVLYSVYTIRREKKDSGQEEEADSGSADLVELWDSGSSGEEADSAEEPGSTGAEET